jgi:hypothetical protein
MSAGRLIVPLAEPCLSSSGVLVSGATMTVYLTGTTTPAVIYADEGLTTPILNPQTSNSAGRFYQQSTAIWADNSVGYDVLLSFPDGETFTFTDIFLLGSMAAGGSYMPISGGTFTGPVYGLTPAANDDSTEIPNTSWVQSLLESYATLISPNFTGTPEAPTAATGTDTTQLATTAFVINQIAAQTSLITAYAQLTISGGVLTIAKNTGFSAITRSGTGAYNLTFTTAQADTNYLVFVTIGNTTQLAGVVPPANKTTTAFAVQVLTSNNNPQDPSAVSILVLGT